MYDQSPIKLNIDTQLVKCDFGEIDILYNVTIERNELYDSIRWLYVTEFIKLVIDKIQNKKLTQLYNEKKLIIYKKKMQSIRSLDEIDARLVNTIYITTL